MSTKTKEPIVSAIDADIGCQRFFENGIKEIWHEWLDIKHAAQYLSVSIGTLRNLTSNGQVPYYKLGRRVRYRTDDLRALLLQNRRGA